MVGGREWAGSVRVGARALTAVCRRCRKRRHHHAHQQVAELVAGADKTVHLDQKVITVRLLGDVAVANGTYMLHFKATSGPIDEKGVFTHVFERVRGNWLCINSQRTAVREETAGKQKKQSSGKQADQPFHIPIFMKDKSSQ